MKLHCRKNFHLNLLDSSCFTCYSLLSFVGITGADVYNALDLCDNESVFKDLKFGAGDGYLQYYVYNWKCPLIDSEEVGLVLV